jgi:hypothetical protein
MSIPYGIFSCLSTFSPSQRICKKLTVTSFERLVLAALAEELTHTQADHMGVDGIYNKIQAVSSSFTRKQMMEALEKLVSREILTEKGMVYSFPVHLLRKWIAARYPLRKVREEI